VGASGDRRHAECGAGQAGWRTRRQPALGLRTPPVLAARLYRGRRRTGCQVSLNRRRRLKDAGAGKSTVYSGFAVRLPLAALLTSV